MGFLLLPVRHSGTGIAYRTVRLYGNSIVLATTEDAADASDDRLRGIIADRLAKHEGVAAVALEGATEDDGWGVRPDARNPGLTFVLPQDARPADVVVPDHPNTARQILRLTYGVARPNELRPRFRAICGETTTRPDGFEVETSTGTLRVVTHKAAADRFLTAEMPEGWQASPGVVAITLLTDSLHELVNILHPAHVPHSVWARSVRVEPSFAGNVILEFVAPVATRLNQ